MSLLTFMFLCWLSYFFVVGWFADRVVAVVVPDILSRREGDENSHFHQEQLVPSSDTVPGRGDRPGSQAGESPNSTGNL